MSTTEKVNLSSATGKFYRTIEIPRAVTMEDYPKIIIHEGRYYSKRHSDWIEVKPLVVGSNTNEKAQSAEETVHELATKWAQPDPDEPRTENTDWELKIAYNSFIKGYMENQPHISQLEHDLAKSQEKCKGYEGALILLVDWEKGINRQSVTYRQRMEIAEQALKQ